MPLPPGSRRLDKPQRAALFRQRWHLLRRELADAGMEADEWLGLLRTALVDSLRRQGWIIAIYWLDGVKKDMGPAPTLDDPRPSGRPR